LVYNPPMTSHPAVFELVLAACVVACRPSESRAPSARANVSVAPPAQQATPTTPTAQPQGTAFGGTMTPTQRVRSIAPGVARPVLRAVETTAGSGGGYDRVVFEFAGDSVPGYRVEYTTKPVQRCGSGDPVKVAGTGRLVVRFEPAEAHDLTAAERHRTPALPAVRELTLVCDFEGQVEWVLGIATPAAYRVSELTGPSRLVLDVKHGP
jgi:hypothetical protein